MTTHYPQKTKFIKQAFIPRDCGFFSAFNFFIGCLSQNKLLYPLFNKTKFLQHNNGINDHFCYWTANKNSWFDFFMPVSFDELDNFHVSEDINQSTITNGSDAPEEFRIPSKTLELFNNAHKFNEWRNKINATYTQFIRLSTKLSDNIKLTLSDIKLNPQNTIGVHYRHPSHFIESGKIYFEQYFEKIDNILDKNNNLEIFLATDSTLAILAFKERYPDRVKYIKNIERVSIDNFLSWAFALGSGKKPDVVGFIGGKGYELHHLKNKNEDNFIMTRDLLTEVFILSQCKYLIHTISNIALSISYINPKIDIITLYETQDKGSS
jgi:hypothetical protein